MADEGEKKQVEILKRMTGAERLAIAFDLFDFARDRVKSGIKQQNPALDEEEIDSLVKKRFASMGDKIGSVGNSR